MKQYITPLLLLCVLLYGTDLQAQARVLLDNTTIQTHPNEQYTYKDPNADDLKNTTFTVVMNRNYESQTEKKKLDRYPNGINYGRATAEYGDKGNIYEIVIPDGYQLTHIDFKGCAQGDHFSYVYRYGRVKYSAADMKTRTNKTSNYTGYERYETLFKDNLGLLTTFPDDFSAKDADIATKATYPIDPCTKANAPSNYKYSTQTAGYTFFSLDLCVQRGFWFQFAGNNAVSCSIILTLEKIDKHEPFTVGGQHYATDNKALTFETRDDVKPYFVYQPSNSDEYNHGAVIAEYNGQLYCMWQSQAQKSPEDNDYAHVKYAYTTSRSEGQDTWCTPINMTEPTYNNSSELLDEAHRGSGNYVSHTYTSPGGWCVSNGLLVAFVNKWTDRKPFGGKALCKTFDGSNWSGLTPVKMADGSDLDGIFEQDPHVVECLDANGNKFQRLVGAAHFQKGLFICPIYTDDLTGRTGWKKAWFTTEPNFISEYKDQSVQMEASLYQKSNGNLVMVFRDNRQTNQLNRTMACESDDYGVTWSNPVSTAMIDSRSKQCAGNISSQVAYIVNNPNTIRNPLAMTLSHDGGNDFDQTILLDYNKTNGAFDNDHKYGYPKSFVGECNGKQYVYVSYSLNKHDIKYVKFPIDKMDAGNSYAVASNFVPEKLSTVDVVPGITMTWGGWKGTDTETGYAKKGDAAGHNNSYSAYPARYDGAGEDSDGNNYARTFDGMYYATHNDDNAYSELVDDINVVTNENYEKDGRKVNANREYGRYHVNGYKAEDNDYRYEYQLQQPNVWDAPCRGSYYMFEPVTNGTLYVNLLANGVYSVYTRTETVNDITYQKDDVKDRASWHPFHIIDEQGKMVDDVTLEKAATPVRLTYTQAKTTRKSNTEFNAPKLGNYLNKKGRDAWLSSIWPTGTDDKVYVVPEAQGGGYLTIEKSYVRASFPVKAGKTYWVFSNYSTLGMCGFKFVEDKNDTQARRFTIFNNNDTDDRSSETTLYGSDGKFNMSALTSDTYANVTLKRKFEEGSWTSLCLPFSVTAKQMRSIFGDDVQLLYFDGIKNQDSQLMASFVNHVYNQMVVAGVPCFIRPGKTVENPVFENVTIDKNAATPHSQKSMYYTFQGVYDNEKMAAYSYFVNGSTLYRISKEKDSNCWRAYLRNDGNNTANIAGFYAENGYDDGEDMGDVTGIAQLLMPLPTETNAVDGHVYDLSGRRVDVRHQVLQPGIYVVNGKKVVVK